MSTKKFPKRWEQAVAALLSEKTIEDAAAKIGVPYRTLKSWLARPEFAALYRSARMSILERTVARLLTMTGQALDALGKNLLCENPSAVNKAVELTLVHAQKGVETLDLLARVEALEAALKGGTQ